MHYVLFEAAEVLKTALIREWGFLQESDILSLRQYLMHFISTRELPSYVQDRILQIIAIIIKRGSVDDFGRERANILNDVESMIVDSSSKRVSNLNVRCLKGVNCFNEIFIKLIPFVVRKNVEATYNRTISCTRE